MVTIQAIIVAKTFQRILLDNKSTKNAIYDETFDKMQKYNPWIPVLEPYHFTSKNLVLHRQATLLVKIGEMLQLSRENLHLTESLNGLQLN